MFMTDKNYGMHYADSIKNDRKKNKHIIHPMSIHLAFSVLEILGEF